MTQSQGGRPPKAPETLRNHQINIRLNKEEKAKLVLLQQASGLTYAEMLLMSESEKVAKVGKLRRVPVEVQKMINGLLKMGNLLAYYKNKVDSTTVQSFAFKLIISQLMIICDYLQKQSLLASGLPSLLTYFDYVAKEIPLMEAFLEANLDSASPAFLNRLRTFIDASCQEHSRLNSYFNTESILIEMESHVPSDLHRLSLVDGLEELLVVMNENHASLLAQNR
jgi:hypothetical protein